MEDILGSISLVNPWLSNHTKTPYDGMNEDFLVKRWNSFHFLKENTRLPLVFGIHKSNGDIHLKQLLIPPQRKIIIDYGTSYHILAIEFWRCKFLSLKLLQYAILALIIQLKFRHTPCWNFPYITQLKIYFCHYLTICIQGASIF